jgi:hypothetical protein
MKKGKEIRNMSIVLYLTPTEKKKLVNWQSKSTSRSMNQYLLRRIFSKAVTTFYRNQSLDEYLEEGMRLRNLLKSLLEKEYLTTEDRDKVSHVLRELQKVLAKISDHVRENEKVQKHPKDLELS